MRYCKTCKWWKERYCKSEDRRKAVLISDCPPTFGCIFHEEKPVEPTCGSCKSWSHESANWVHDTRECKGYNEGRTYTTSTREGCQHHSPVKEQEDDGWISVEDRLPLTQEIKWVVFEKSTHKIPYLAWYKKTGWMWPNTKDSMCDKITHWRSLDMPEPPKDCR